MSKTLSTNNFVKKKIRTEMKRRCKLGFIGLEKVMDKSYSNPRSTT